MAKKNGTISINEFEKAIAANYEAKTDVKYGDLTVTVDRNLGLGDTYAFIRKVIDICFDEGSGEYMPWVKGAALSVATVLYYTNLTLPKNIEAAYWDVVTSGVIEELIYPNIDMRQYGSICEAIDRGIRYRASVHEEAVERKLEALCNAMNELGEQFQSSMEGISKEDIASLVDVLSRAAEE